MNNRDQLNLRSGANITTQKTVIIDTPGYEVVIFRYEVPKSGYYIITDLLGHRVFLDESLTNDTLKLVAKQFNLLPGIAKKFYLTDSVKAPWSYKISYPTKYSYLGFFDSLCYLHGDTRFSNYSFKGYNHDLTRYLAKVSQVYLDRVRFLHWFVARYNMPAAAKYYASEEIRYSYYEDLFSPVMEWDSKIINDYPQALKDTLNQLALTINNQQLLENVLAFKTVLKASISTLHVTGGGLRDKPDSNYYINRLHYCKSRLTGQVRGFALAWFMSRLAYEGQKSLFNLFYQQYDHTSSSAGVNEFVDSLRTITSKTGITPDDVLNFSFENKTHASHTLRESINKDLVLIDCWATWCIPCRQEMPYMDTLATMYKDKVQFISISADEVSAKWDKWMSEQMVSSNRKILQLHAQGGFNHLFYRRFLITAIPRYLLITKEGKIVDANAPRPSDPKLREMIESTLKDLRR